MYILPEQDDWHKFKKIKKVVLAKLKFKLCKSFNTGKLSLMDYYKLRNVILMLPCSAIAGEPVPV